VVIKALLKENIAFTESWNGTSWTEVNDLNTAKSGLAGAGLLKQLL
jgi:hypothetical protein